MLTLYAASSIPTTIKLAALNQMIAEFASRKEITEHAFKNRIFLGLREYLNVVNGRIFTFTNPQRISAAYQIAEILANSDPNNEFYTAVACKWQYEFCFGSQADLDSSSFGRTMSAAIHDYFNTVAAPKIKNYLNTGLSLLITCFTTRLFLVNYATFADNILQAGVMLGLTLIACALSMPYMPELTMIDNVITQNPQLRNLLENVTEYGQNTLRLVNNGLNRINNRLTM